MRRTAFLLVAMAAGTLVAGGVALAATVLGTAKAEVLVGTRYSDDIRAGGGGGEVRGLRGPDRLEGGRGEDMIRGGRGDDFIGSFDARDGDDGLGNVVRCGPGHDTVAVDRSDRVASSCEDVSVPVPGPAWADTRASCRPPFDQLGVTVPDRLTKCGPCRVSRERASPLGSVEPGKEKRRHEDRHHAPRTAPQKACTSKV